MRRTMTIGRWRHAVSALVLLAGVSLAAAQEAKPEPKVQPKAPTDTELAEALVKASGQKDKRREFFDAYRGLGARLENQDAAVAKKTAEVVLARLNDLLPAGQAREAITKAVKAPGGTIAAQRLLALAQAQNLVGATGKGKAVFGQLKVEDGKVSPEMVLAQMVIMPDGWFATEIGDTAKPLGFRAAGYRPLDADIPDETDQQDLGVLTMQPVGKGDGATLKGKVVFEGPDGSKELTATVSLSVPMPNTLTGGYSPRKKWPQPQPITVGKDGTFEVRDATPGDHFLSLQSPRHEGINRRVSVKAGATEDLGALTLRTTDLGYYIGREAPKAVKFPWEKDIEAARKRAKDEGKPMMIMMTATWCGPCKMLESKTLSDPWVQKFLKEFVVVQAYEDKEVEKLYDGNAYPTLVFTDKTGKEMHRTLGYQPAGVFSGNILKACQELGIPPDADLKTLADKKVVKVPAAAKKASPLK